MQRSKKKAKKKLALGSLIQSDQDPTAVGKPQPYNLQSPKLQGGINPSVTRPGTGEGIKKSVGNFPLWGQLYTATQGVTKGIRGNGTNSTNNAAASFISPSSAVLGAVEDRDYKGAIAEALLPGLGNQMTTQRAKRKLADRNRRINAQVDDQLLQNAGMKDGGRLVAKRLKVEKGGSLNPISDDAVEVQANDPELTDSVETKDAFLDHNEIVDKKDRVFSDVIKTPSGKSVAKTAKKLEKQKNDGVRFKGSNGLIDKKLDELFHYQESTKQQQRVERMELGGYMSSKAPDWQQKLVYNSIDNPSVHPNQIIEVMSKHEKRLGGKLSSRDAIKGEGSSRTPQTVITTEDRAGVMSSKPDYSKGGIHIKPENKGKFNALKQRTGKTTEELKHSKNPLTRKRATFATNAKKWHHEFGGNMEKGGDGAGAWKNRIRYGYATGGKFDWSSAGNTLSTFAPNIVNGVLQNQLKGPAAPRLETYTKLDRVNPAGQLAEIDTDTNNINTALTRNTAQASNLTSALGSSLSRKLKAKNDVQSRTQQINAGIQGNEASIRAGQQGRNVDRLTGFNNEQVQFSNKKLQLASENVANLSGKFQSMNRENNERKLDKGKYKIMMEAFNNLPKIMRDHYKTFNYDDWGLAKGGKLKRVLGGKLNTNRK